MTFREMLRKLLIILRHYFLGAPGIFVAEHKYAEIFVIKFPHSDTTIARWLCYCVVAMYIDGLYIVCATV